MVIFPLAPDQTIAQMWSNGARRCVLEQKLLFTELQPTESRILEIDWYEDE